MSKNPQPPPPGLELAALRKNTAAALDLMRPGMGTPWEDRGSIGVVLAYFKTTVKSLTSPALLLDHIRRPETTDDASAYMWASIAMWVIGIFAYYVYWLYGVLPHQTYYEQDVELLHYWLTAAGTAALVGGGIFLFVRTGTRMFIAMAGNELKGVSPALITSCFCYSLGPSIFAVVPFFGWVIAPAWIYFNLIVAGKRRLYLKGGGAFINATLIIVSAVAVAIVAYFVLSYMWGSYLGLNGLTVHVIPKAKTPPPL